jgi:hypothetical protein
MQNLHASLMKKIGRYGSQNHEPLFNVYHRRHPHGRRAPRPDAIDNFANHYGNFDTEEGALAFAASLPPEKIHKSNDLLDTMYVIEKRALIYSRIALAPGGVRQ